MLHSAEDFKLGGRGHPTSPQRQSLRPRPVSLKVDWAKPGRFGGTIALCVLNGTDLFCGGYGATQSRILHRLAVMLPPGHRDCNCPDKPKTHSPSALPRSGLVQQVKCVRTHLTWENLPSGIIGGP